MKKRTLFIIPLIIFLALGTFVVDIQAESDDQPLDDEFVEALVMMAVNHNMMEGKDELSDLSALHDLVSNYYEIRVISESDPNAINSMIAKGAYLTKMIEDEMAIKSNQGLLNTFLTIFTDTEVLNITRDSMELKRFVSGNDNPPGDYFNTMNSLIMTDFEAQVNLLLDIDTITVQPSLTSLVVDNSSWSLNLPAISNSTASITLTDEVEPQLNAEIVDNFAPLTNSDAGALKTVCFNNNGYEAATVIVDYYQPAAGMDTKKPTASTVVFPETGSSACLDLPLGVYSFCYYWELDKDTNNDGYYDYHHYSTDIITLEGEANSSLKSAKTVTLTTDSTISKPNGKCGEDLAPIYTAPADPAPAEPKPEPVQPDNSGLTQEEAANAGTHTYYVRNNEYGGYESVTVSFSGNSVNIIKHFIDDEYNLTREGPNRYSWYHEAGHNYLIVTFSSDGFLLNMSDLSFATHTLAD